MTSPLTCSCDLDRLADGSLHLTAVGLLAPHLTAANHLEVLDSARHKSKRDVEQLVARLRPQPDVQSVVRKLPSTRSLVQDSRETYETLRCVQDLMRHTIPNGDPSVIFDRALTLLLDRLSRTKLASTSRPHRGRVALARSRHIPALVKREVWTRDGGRCAFRGEQGRCVETGFLEFHHVVPYADGGETSASNIELRCRSHNEYEADQWFGATQSPLVRETRALLAGRDSNSVRTEPPPHTLLRSET